MYSKCDQRFLSLIDDAIANSYERLLWIIYIINAFVSFVESIEADTYYTKDLRINLFFIFDFAYVLHLCCSAGLVTTVLERISWYFSYCLYTNSNFRFSIFNSTEYNETLW